MPHPPLHDLVTALAAPCSVLSDTAGDVSDSGAQGVFVSDRRALSLCRTEVDGHDVVPLSHTMPGGPVAHFVATVNGAGDAIPAPPSPWRAAAKSTRPGSWT